MGNKETPPTITAHNLSTIDNVVMPEETNKYAPVESDRVYDVAGKEVYHSYRDGRSADSGIYIKRPHSGAEGGYGDVVHEAESYGKVREYLRMPKVRVLKDKDGIEILTVQKVFGESIADLLLNEPDKAVSALNVYVGDVNNMWKETSKKMNPAEVEIDKKEDYEKRIESFLNSSEAQEFLNAKEVTINGVSYTDLRGKLNKVLSDLKSKSDPVMTLGHGDDHLGNILNDDKSSEANYYAIDPMSSGYYSPSVSYLNTATHLLLYKYNFTNEKINNSNGIDLKYHLNGKFKKSSESIVPVIRQMEENLHSLSNEQFLTKEYFIGNLLRFVQKQNDPKNFDHTNPNNLAYLAMAIELASDKYKDISEIYEQLIHN